jgi:CHAT domain-containing protein
VTGSHTTPADATEGSAVAAELGVTALIGPAATKAAVLAARRPVVVHLATHAFFGEPSSVAITMSTSAPAATATDAQPVTMADLSIADPGDLRRQLTRAGLALAGANDADLAKRKAVGDPRHDLDYGLLLAIDVLDLDLTATELVVLSACDTGRGRAIVAQGLWGLPLALQVAGAQRTVSSLWPVDDDSTCELMTAFYRAIASGQRPAAALQAAARLVRQTHPEPRYWAPFVMIGDQRPIVGLTAAATG